MKHVERVNRTLVHAGSIVDVYQDEMVLPDGKHENWDFVSHRMGAAAVIPVLPDGRILLVHQYRPALDRMTWEVPAGARDAVTEDTLKSALPGKTVRNPPALEGTEVMVVDGIYTAMAMGHTVRYPKLPA